MCAIWPFELDISQIAGMYKMDVKSSRYNIIATSEASLDLSPYLRYLKDSASIFHINMSTYFLPNVYFKFNL